MLNAAGASLHRRVYNSNKSWSSQVQQVEARKWRINSAAEITWFSLQHTKTPLSSLITTHSCDITHAPPPEKIQRLCGLQCIWKLMCAIVRVGGSGQSPEFFRPPPWWKSESVHLGIVWRIHRDQVGKLMMFPTWDGRKTEKNKRDQVQRRSFIRRRPQRKMSTWKDNSFRELQVTRESKLHVLPLYAAPSLPWTLQRCACCERVWAENHLLRSSYWMSKENSGQSLGPIVCTVSCLKTALYWWVPSTLGTQHYSPIQRGLHVFIRHFNTSFGPPKQHAFELCVSHWAGQQFKLYFVTMCSSIQQVSSKRSHGVILSLSVYWFDAQCLEAQMCSEWREVFLSVQTVFSIRVTQLWSVSRLWETLPRCGGWILDSSSTWGCLFVIPQCTGR